MAEGASGIGDSSGDNLGKGKIQVNDIDMAAANGTGNGSGEKRKTKVIHFADGSTMEDYDEDESDTANTNTGNGTLKVEEKIAKMTMAESESNPPVDPSRMQWSEWMRHQTSKAGVKTLSVLEGMGGTAAYYLGITTPKYQSEIDEYNRMQQKKKSHEEELVSWSTGPNAQQGEQGPVVQDVKAKSEDVAVTNNEK